MAIGVKICGLKTPETVAAAMQGGVAYIGFMFYPPSPRYVTPAQALDLGRDLPKKVIKVGVLVNPDDALIDEVLPAVDALQLHGQETPARIDAVKTRTGKLMIRSQSLGEAADLEPIRDYADIADMMLFDAKPPKTGQSLPGGNGLSFDWRLLEGLDLPCPWMLAGGLHTGNLEEAIRLCRARLVDVSSGVEAEPGIKDLAKIRGFLDLAASLDPPQPLNGTKS